jgi:hypothetical protein
MIKHNTNFYSLCRSGHHAVIFWIINNLGGADESYKDVYAINKKSGIYFYNNVSVFTKEYLQKKNKMFQEYPTNYTWLIKNYEDELFIQGVCNFVVVRDFLNLICSRYKKWGERLRWSDECGVGALPELIKYWKQHAEQHSTDNFISYNKWFKDKYYRNQIAAKIGVQNNVDNITYVPLFAGGSSFIGTQKEKNINIYEERYKQIKLPQKFIDIILNDLELIEMNKTVFNVDILNLLQ